MRFIFTYLVIKVLIGNVFLNSFNFTEYCIIPNQSRNIIANNSYEEISFSVCIDTPDNSKISLATLHNFNTHEKINLGTRLDNSTKDTLKYFEGDICENVTKYSLVVEFHCNGAIQTPPQISTSKKNNCEYRLTIMSPTCKPCTVQVDNHLFDLRNLTESITVKSLQRQFSIQLCGENKNCNGSFTSCEILGNQINPLASSYSQELVYTENHLEIHGRFKNDSRYNRLKLVLHCNWDEILTNITYRVPLTQGKLFEFSAESKYACYKRKHVCKLNEGWYNYNLEQLNNPNGWIVSDISKNTLIINVCGPLNIPSVKRCQGTQSQVCSVSENKNRGSIMTELTYMDEALQLSFFDGDICNKSTLEKFSTKILFYCSDVEMGPMIYMGENSTNISDHCSLQITWKTPAACPQIKDKICENTPSLNHSCLFEISGRRYDLSKLYKQGGYRISNPNNNFEDYFLTPCRNVQNKLNICDKSSLGFLRRIDEPNIKKKFLSVGKIPLASVEGNNLKLELTEGALCTEMFENYKTVIYFKCSSHEDLPKLIEHKDCVLKFEWSTPEACPVVNDCLIPTNQDSQFNLGFLSKNIISLKDKDDNVANISLCSNFYATCVQGECTTNMCNRKMFIDDEAEYIIIHLNRECKPSFEFNVIQFNLLCDENSIENYFENKGIENCILQLLVKSIHFCKTNSPKPESLNSTSQLQEKMNVPRNTKCNITSPMTGYTLDISFLTPNIKPLKSFCPNVTLNFTTQSAKLYYLSNIDCSHGKATNFTHVVYLKCSTINQISSKKGDICNQNTEATSIEACNLFKTSHKSYSKALIGGISSAVIVIIILIGFYYWRNRKRSQFMRPYLKDMDL